MPEQNRTESVDVGPSRTRHVPPCGSRFCGTSRIARSFHTVLPSACSADIWLVACQASFYQGATVLFLGVCASVPSFSFEDAWDGVCVTVASVHASPWSASRDCPSGYRVTP